MQQQLSGRIPPTAILRGPCIWFKVKNYLRSGTRVRHETPHPTRLQAPTPQGETISWPFQWPPQTLTPDKRQCQSDPIARRSYKFFVQHIVYYSSLKLDQTDTKIRQRTPEGPQTITRLPPNGAEAPKSHKMRYSRPNYSPWPKLNL